MGFLSRVKASLSPYSDYWYGTGGYGLATTTGRRVNSDSAMRATAVYRCVRLIAGTVGMLPLKMYRSREDGGKDLARNNPLYDVLHTRPNQRHTSQELREMLTGHLLLRGNAYAEIVPGPRGAVDQLIPLHPDWMERPELLDSGRLVYPYRIPGAKRPRRFTQDEILHLRSFTQDGVLGINPIEYHRESIGLALAEEEYGARMFSNGAQLGGVLRHPKTLSEEAQKRLKKSFDDDHVGTEKSFRTMVLEEGMEWTQISMRARDAQYLESRHFQISEIARIFGVPLHMIAEQQKDTSWGSGIEQQQIGFVTQTIQYWLVLWEQTILRDLVIAPETYFPKFTVEGLLRGDIETRYTAHASAIDHGWKTRNEVRLNEDMNPAPGLDEFLKPLNMGTSSEVDQIQQESARAKRIITNAAQRLAKKELAAVRKNTRLVGDHFTEWVDNFYAGYAADLATILQVSSRAAQAFALRAKEAVLHADDVSALLDSWEASRSDELFLLATSSEQPAATDRRNVPCRISTAA